jgi:hypothetical protein
VRRDDAAPIAKALDDVKKRSLLEVVGVAIDPRSPRNGSDFFAQPSAFSDIARKADTHFLLRKLRSLFEGRSQQVSRATYAIVQSQSLEFKLFSKWR